MFVNVAVPVPGLPPLTYKMTGLSAEAGMRVVVPLGRRMLTGVVVTVDVPVDGDPRKIKSIFKAFDEEPVLTPSLLKLGRWMAGYYRCNLGEALDAMLPGAYKPKVKQVYHLNSEQYPVASKRGTARILLERLLQGSKEKKELLKDLPANATKYLRDLEKEDIIRCELSVPKTRSSKKSFLNDVERDQPKTLTTYQSKALLEIKAALDQQAFKTFLLFGVTGSGKTEVYLQAMAHALEQGGGALILVPEIALTPQTQRRIAARFGAQVAVLHSGLTPKERMDAWTRLQKGEARVALGARSAVFAPVKNLRIIVVDEEYEHSYKQDDSPRYHARDIAAVRAKDEKAVLVQGSATPSLESFYNTEIKRFQLLELPERIDGKQMPVVQLLDMSQEFSEKKGVPLFSQTLLTEIGARLHKKEQSILFLNRRGFAPLVMCPDCKHVVTCPDCSVSLVYHLKGNRLECHSCGRTFKTNPACPKCGAACVRMVGAGTQKVETDLKKIFPEARVLRLDQDATRKKGVLEAALATFNKGEADILVGTQMVAKGMDFPNVTLVGILSADTALHLPDFRAEERTFQLLVQVAGRAGRGGLPGLVVAQTINPDHDVLQMARNHDYRAFYHREIENRKALGYPPFGRMANIICRSENEHAAQLQAEKIAAVLRQKAQSDDRILGPVPATYQRIARESRFQVLIKSLNHQKRGQLLEQVPAIALKSGVKISVDVDPLNML